MLLLLLCQLGLADVLVLNDGERIIGTDLTLKDGTYQITLPDGQSQQHSQEDVAEAIISRKFRSAWRRKIRTCDPDDFAEIASLLDYAQEKGLIEEKADFFDKLWKAHAQDRRNAKMPAVAQLLDLAIEHGYNDYISQGLVILYRGEYLSAQEQWQLGRLCSELGDTSISKRAMKDALEYDNESLVYALNDAWDECLSPSPDGAGQLLLSCLRQDLRSARRDLDEKGTEIPADEITEELLGQVLLNICHKTAAKEPDKALNLSAYLIRRGYADDAKALRADLLSQATRADSYPLRMGYIWDHADNEWRIRDDVEPDTDTLDPKEIRSLDLENEFLNFPTNPDEFEQWGDRWCKELAVRAMFIFEPDPFREDELNVKGLSGLAIRNDTPCNLYVIATHSWLEDLKLDGKTPVTPADFDVEPDDELVLKTERGIRLRNVVSTGGRTTVTSVTIMPICRLRFSPVVGNAPPVEFVLRMEILFDGKKVRKMTYTLVHMPIVPVLPIGPSQPSSDAQEQ